MARWTRKTKHSTGPVYIGQHRFEHWYRDNQVYFLTARCRDRFPALSVCVKPWSYMLFSKVFATSGT